LYLNLVNGVSNKEMVNSGQRVRETRRFTRATEQQQKKRVFLVSKSDKKGPRSETEKQSTKAQRCNEQQATTM